MTLQPDHRATQSEFDIPNNHHMNSDLGLEAQAVFYPELLSRRGEFIAWGTSLIVLLGWIILSLNGRQVPFAVPFLGIILVFAALAISLGNWMDRKTELRLSADGVTYENGLRYAALDWKDINEIRVFPSKWGKKVHVLGGTKHFNFRTLGEVKVQDEVKGRMGFAEGDKILSVILDHANLKQIAGPGPGCYYGPV
ncbi:hypothetical protein ACFLV7_06155 [Chloroflexota bacterium]